MLNMFSVFTGIIWVFNFNNVLLINSFLKLNICSADYYIHLNISIFSLYTICIL